jgi:hypothetical protein
MARAPRLKRLPEPPRANQLPTAIIIAMRNAVSGLRGPLIRCAGAGCGRSRLPFGTLC